MKRILALCVCLCLFFCTALAEVTLPTVPPSQAELRTGFVMNLFRFLAGTDLDDEALSFMFKDGNQILAHALLQQADGVVDLDAALGGVPVQIQLTDDAVLALYDGQLYKLPFETIAQFFSSMSEEDGDSKAAPDHEFFKMLELFRETVLTPSVSVEETDGGHRFGIDISAERLIAFGDAIFGSGQYQALLAKLCGGIDIASAWPEWREMLESGQAPFSLTGSVTLSDAGLTGAVEGALFGTAFSMNLTVDSEAIAFDAECAGEHTASGRLDLATGAFTWHAATGDGQSFDLTFTPGDGGWTLDADAAADDASVKLSLRDAADAFEAALDCAEYAEEVLNVQFTVEKSTWAIGGKLQAQGGVSAELAGAPTDDGYHATLDISQDGTPVANADLVLIDDEQMAAAELNVTGSGASLGYASLAFAKETGAYTFRYDGADDTFVDGRGVITMEEQTCFVEAGTSGEVEARFDYRRVDNDSVYEQSYACYQDFDGSGTLSKLFESSFTVDKVTNGFYGCYRIPMRHIDFQIQGLCDESVFKLRIDDLGIFGSRLDLSWIKGEEGFMGAFNLGLIGLSASGNLLWSPCMKSLSAALNQNNFKATLSQGRDGTPQELQLSANLYGLPGLRMRPAQFSLVATKGQLLLRVNGENIAVTGGFKDKNTYAIEVVRDEGRPGRETRYTFSAIADPDQVSLRVDAMPQGDSSEVRLAHVPGKAFDSLADRADALVITPEILEQMLEDSESATN